jgi:hypothetical protein
MRISRSITCPSADALEEAGCTDVAVLDHCRMSGPTSGLLGHRLHLGKAAGPHDDQKARLGFIGAGWWATANYMPLLAAREDVELAAVCRLGRDELRRVKEHFGFAFATEDAAELVAQPGLDAVVVTSPHTLHHQHAKLALSRGLHVLCEKPMCTRGEHARELVRLAQAKGVHLLVPYGWHYKPFVQQAKQWLDDGAVGTVQYVLCHMASPIRDLLRGQRFEVESSSGQPAGLFRPTEDVGRSVCRRRHTVTHSSPLHRHALLAGRAGAASGLRGTMSAGAKVDLYDAISVRFASRVSRPSGGRCRRRDSRLPGGPAHLRQRRTADARLRAGDWSCGDLMAASAAELAPDASLFLRRAAEPSSIWFWAK